MKSKAAVISALVLFGLMLSSCDKKNASLVNRRTATPNRIEEIRVATAKAEYLAAVEVYKAAVREFLRPCPSAARDALEMIKILIIPLLGWEEDAEHLRVEVLSELDEFNGDDKKVINALLMPMFDARDKAKAAGVLERLGALGVPIMILGGNRSPELSRIAYDLFGFRLPSPPSQDDDDEDDEGGGVAA
ncbi:hypothetical protein AGMMS49990_00540 [Endomicrobiia bacterium]|nr:hypothetical protein AGMMS49990_00540 [Endomicrobiia bacterium]